jgi:hypothetical protein
MRWYASIICVLAYLNGFSYSICFKLFVSWYTSLGSCASRFTLVLYRSSSVSTLRKIRKRFPSISRHGHFSVTDWLPGLRANGKPKCRSLRIAGRSNFVQMTFYFFLLLPQNSLLLFPINEQGKLFVFSLNKNCTVAYPSPSDP